MAIVKEYKTAKGVIIRFNDAAYAEKAEKEKQELRENLNIVISQILSKQRG